MKKLLGKNIAIVGGPGIAQTFTKFNLRDEVSTLRSSYDFQQKKILIRRTK